MSSRLTPGAKALSFSFFLTEETFKKPVIVTDYPKEIKAFYMRLNDDEKTVAAAHEAYGALVEQATDRAPDADELHEMTAYQMAATVDFGLEAKQGLLDLRSENARLRLVTRLFRAASRRLEFIERAEARARSNGKVRFS